MEYNADQKVREKYTAIIKQSLLSFQEEVREMQYQYNNLRIQVLKRDELVKKLYLQLYSQESNFTDIKTSLLYSARHSREDSFLKMDFQKASDGLTHPLKSFSTLFTAVQTKEFHLDRLVSKQKKYKDEEETIEAPKPLNVVGDEKVYKIEILYLKNEINALKNLNENYMSQIERRDNEIMQMKDEIRIIKGEHIREVKELKENFHERVSQLEHELNEERQKDKSYKKYTDTELDLVKRINDRLKGYIGVLKKELVLAKNVIKDPAKLNAISKIMNYEYYEIK